MTFWSECKNFWHSDQKVKNAPDQAIYVHLMKQNPINFFNVYLILLSFISTFIAYWNKTSWSHQKDLKCTNHSPYVNQNPLIFFIILFLYHIIPLPMNHNIMYHTIYYVLAARPTSVHDALVQVFSKSTCHVTVLHDYICDYINITIHLPILIIWNILSKTKA